jgi:hypothetical protein
LRSRAANDNETKMSTKTMFDILLAGPDRFDYATARAWTAERRNWSLGFVAIYLITLFGLKRAMKNRPAYSLQVPLVLWNMALAAFSIAGAAVVFAEYGNTFAEYGFEGTYCRARQFFHGRCGYFVWLFTLSKVVELGDSFFLVLRKRPLSFLQYYHHALTLVYCWFSYCEQPSFNRVGTVLNFGVHSIMYSYFLLRSLRVVLPAFVARCVTGIQILQFICSTCMLTYGYVQVTFNGASCDWPTWLGNVALGMNISYLYLFGDFFYNAYVARVAPREHVKHVKTQ